MKKKKIAVLSLAFASAIAFGGGSAAVSAEQYSYQDNLMSTLDRLETHSNLTYDFSSPQNMLLQDDYFLFYENGDYEIQNARSYMFSDRFTTPLRKSDEMDYNSSQNRNNGKYYALRNTSNQTNNEILNKTASTNNSNNQNMSITNTQTTNATGSTNTNRLDRTTNSIANTNLVTQNSTSKTSSIQNQSNNGSDYLSNINQTKQAQNYAPNYSMGFDEFSNNLTSINSELSSNIQTLRNNINSGKTTSDERAMKAYGYTLKNITNKLDFEQRNFVGSLNRYALTNSSDNEASVSKALELDLKATLLTKQVLLGCANKAIVELNSLFDQTNISSSTKAANNTQTQTNIRNQNDTTNSNFRSNNTNTTSQSSKNNTNYQNSSQYNALTVSASAFDNDESVATPQIVRENNTNKTTKNGPFKTFDKANKAN